ncbi:hypothetical protein MHYP_G00166300 [Metynnis hypsauchen]
MFGAGGQAEDNVADVLVHSIVRAIMPKEKGRGKDETYWREINAAMALTNLAQPKDGGPSGTTSCIIQKSSHIAEIKTVKVPILHKY